MRVGVFDSGIGGLTVLKELKKAMPNAHEYVYFGDRLNAPYGDKGPEEIKTNALKIIEYLLTQNLDAIVVACNTIVANAMDEIQKAAPVPVIGVIDPTIEHIQAAGYKNVGIAATSATIKSGIYQSKLRALGINSHPVACPKLVPLIESNNFGTDLDNAIAYHFQNFLGKNLDALVLGCTHYPIIVNQIQAYLTNFGETMDLINPANFIAEKLKALSNNKDTFVFTKIDKDLPAQIANILTQTP